MSVYHNDIAMGLSPSVMNYKGSQQNLMPLFAIILVASISAFLYSSTNLKIPGPYAAKFTRLWYLWQMRRGDFHWTNINLHRQYGKSQLETLSTGVCDIDL